MYFGFYVSCFFFQKTARDKDFINRDKNFTNRDIDLTN